MNPDDVGFDPWINAILDHAILVSISYEILKKVEAGKWLKPYQPRRNINTIRFFKHTTISFLMKG